MIEHTAKVQKIDICQIPPALKPGDLLRVIAPSGALKEFEAFERGVQIWRDRGYRVEIDPGVEDRWGYLAGIDENRRHQLKEAWLDPEVKGILCARGGYGSTRILENWIWPFEDSEITGRGMRTEVLTTNKWLIGFSDVTALLWSLFNHQISGVHGPLLTTLASEPDWSIQRLFDWVEGKPLQPLPGIGWCGGKATGILLPANLTVATHLLGTPLLPELAGVILAFEDVTEYPYRIDRVLTQWRMSGAFDKIKGIALGRFSRCDAPAPSFTVEEVLRDRLRDLGIPIISELPFGHDGPNAALPVGIVAHLDSDGGILSFE